MPLKFQMDSVEDLDPAIAGLYTKQDTGKFVLTGVENIVHKSKLDEFRNNNIELNKKLDTFKDIDPTNHAKMVTDIAEYKIQLEAKGAQDEDAVTKLVESRVATIQKDAAATQARLEGTITTQGRQLESLIIDGNINTASIENKVLDSALTDVNLRAKSVFKLIDGKPVAMDASGNKMYGADGVSELSMTEWVKGLIKTSPHLFQPSVTGGLKDNSGNFTGDASKLSPAQKILQGLNG